MPHLWTGGSRCGWSTWVIFNKGRWFGENNPTQTTESWKVSEANSMFNALMSAGCFDTCARMGTAGLDGSSFAWWWYDLTIWWLLWKISGHHITNQTTSKPLYYVSCGLKSWVSEIVVFPFVTFQWTWCIDHTWPNPVGSSQVRIFFCGVIPVVFLQQTVFLSFWRPLLWISGDSMSLHQILGRKDIIIGVRITSSGPRVPPEPGNHFRLQNAFRCWDTPMSQGWRGHRWCQASCPGAVWFQALRIARAKNNQKTNCL